jgi:hypothetical protein
MTTLTFCTVRSPMPKYPLEQKKDKTQIGAMRSKPGSHLRELKKPRQEIQQRQTKEVRKSWAGGSEKGGSSWQA